ncbi:hypothetical protein [Pedobacter sp. N23S346]|uniref:hypothetical protein n=1 Tax=Pedobacter sp. N23S346 TaxID=3402750 RepID=UPI003AC80E63
MSLNKGGLVFGVERLELNVWRLVSGIESQEFEVWDDDLYKNKGDTVWWLKIKNQNSIYQLNH